MAGVSALPRSPRFRGLTRLTARGRMPICALHSTASSKAGPCAGAHHGRKRRVIRSTRHQCCSSGPGRDLVCLRRFRRLDRAETAHGEIFRRGETALAL